MALNLKWLKNKKPSATPARSKTAVKAVVVEEKKKRTRRRRPKEKVAARMSPAVQEGWGSRGQLQPASVAKAEAVSLNNAALFLKSLAQPWLSTPQRFPDAAVPSAVASLPYEIVISEVKDSVTNQYWGVLQILPRVKAQYYTVTAVAGGMFTWSTSSDIPVIATIENYFTTYRMVGLGVEIMNTRNWSTRDGQFYFTEMPESVLVSGEPEFICMPGLETVSFGADEFVRGTFRRAWRPKTFQPHLTNSSGNEGSSGLGWKDPSETAVYDTSLVFAYRSSVSAANSMRVRVWPQLELIPFPAAQQFYDCRAPVGSVEAVEKVNAAIEIAAADSQALDIGQWTRAVVKVVDPILRAAEGCWRNGAQFYGSVKGFGSALSGLFTSPRHEALVQRLVSYRSARTREGPSLKLVAHVVNAIPAEELLDHELKLQDAVVDPVRWQRLCDSLEESKAAKSSHGGDVEYIDAAPRRIAPSEARVGSYVLLEGQEPPSRSRSLPPKRVDQS